jgi:hypothetical protein
MERDRDGGWVQDRMNGRDTEMEKDGGSPRPGGSPPGNLRRLRVATLSLAELSRGWEPPGPQMLRGVGKRRSKNPVHSLSPP